MNDNGTRHIYPSGALREAEPGKGSYELLSPYAEDRVAKWAEMGAKKYGERNWEDGMPFGRFFQAAKRHLNKYHRGLDDEDHLAAAIWNISAIIHFEEMIRLGLIPEDLDNMPAYERRKQ
jgi:hypothetical protein